MDTTEHIAHADPSPWGKLRPPYPVKRCAASDCRVPLAGTVSAFLYRDLETRKLVVLCEDCAMAVELLEPRRFIVVPL